MSDMKPLCNVRERTRCIGNGAISRRGFLRYSTLFVASIAAADRFAAGVTGGGVIGSAHGMSHTVTIRLNVTPQGDIVAVLEVASDATESDPTYDPGEDKRMHLPHNGQHAKITMLTTSGGQDEFWWKGAGGWRHAAEPGPGEGNPARLELEIDVNDGSVARASEWDGGSWVPLAYDSAESNRIADGKSRIAHLQNACCWRKTPTGWRCSSSFC